jgi:hypothetical protein
MEARKVATPMGGDTDVATSCSYNYLAVGLDHHVINSVIVPIDRATRKTVVDITVARSGERTGHEDGQDQEQTGQQ